MTARLLASIAQYAVVVAVVLVANFALPRLAPGDPLDYLHGDQTVHLDAADRSRILRQFGLDRSVPAQFRSYLADLVRGNLGVSVQYRRPVSEVLRERLPWTLGLAGAGLAVAGMLGIALGAFAGWHHGRPADGAVLAVAAAVHAVPAFWVGMLLLFAFGVIAANLAADLAYPLLDPRIRYPRRGY